MTEDEEGEVCEALNTVTVCNNLNDSYHLCLPSSWAGNQATETPRTTVLSIHAQATI